MTRIVLDDAFRAKLNGCREKVELCEETGRTVGFFLPEEAYWKLQLAADGCPFSYEELHQSFQDTSGRPLPDIWTSLGHT